MISALNQKEEDWKTLLEDPAPNADVSEVWAWDFKAGELVTLPDKAAPADDTKKEDSASALTASILAAVAMAF